MPNRATRRSVRIDRCRNFLRRNTRRGDGMRLQRCTEPTYFRSKAREFGGFCVSVYGVNFGHRTLGRGTGAMIPAGFHSHRADLDVPRGGLSFSHGSRDLNPPDESLLFVSFFSSFLFSCLYLAPRHAGSNATRRHFIFARLIKFGTTSTVRYPVLMKRTGVH